MSRTHRDTLEAKRKRGLVQWDWHWLNQWPAWWDDLFHTRPSRRKEKARLHETLTGDLRETLTGGEPTDWPDHRKPHKHFW